MKATQKRTRAAIKAQLLTNCGGYGSAGGAYRTAYQVRMERGIDFDQRIKVTEDGATIPLELYMEHCFVRSADAVKLEKKLRKLIEAQDPEAGLSFSDKELLVAAMDKVGVEPEANGREHKWWNMCNDTANNDLDGTLQSLIVKWNDKLFAIVQVHGATDYCGGYTDGTVYEVPEHDRLYDVQVDFTNEGGSYEVSFYEAKEQGAEWNEDRQELVWPNGEAVSWYANIEA